MITYLFDPPPVAALAVRGLAQRFPVKRLFFVGRNYAAHAAEMGFTVDKSRETPFYFTKSLSTLVPSGGALPYPPGTRNFHYEVELVVALHQGGFEVTPEQAPALIYGYGVGLDMTRRDLQQAARELGRPWDLGKDVEHGAVCSELLPLPGQVLAPSAIGLQVNGQTRQDALRHVCERADPIDRLVLEIAREDAVHAALPAMLTVSAVEDRAGRP